MHFGVVVEEQFLMNMKHFLQITRCRQTISDCKDCKRLSLILATCIINIWFAVLNGIGTLNTYSYPVHLCHVHTHQFVVHASYFPAQSTIEDFNAVWFSRSMLLAAQNEMNGNKIKDNANWRCYWKCLLIIRDLLCYFFF